MIDVVNDVVFLADVVGGAHNTNWFVERDIDEFFLRSADGFVVYGNDIAWLYFGAHFRNLPIDAHAPLLYEFVGGPARAVTNFTEVFIDACRFVLLHVASKLAKLIEYSCKSEAVHALQQYLAKVEEWIENSYNIKWWNFKPSQKDTNFIICF